MDKEECLRKERKRFLALECFAYGTLLLLAAAIITVAFWTLYPYDTIETSPQPYPILDEDKVLHQGDYLSYKFDFVKNTCTEATVERNFVDGLIFSSTDDTLHLQEGSGTAYVEVPIPYTLPPGTYKLYIVLKFQVNPLREIVHEVWTEEFTVLER
jgi:hypothetical protein